MLNPDQIQKGLHTIGKHPVTLTFAYLGLNIRCLGVDDISLLKNYSNIMFLDISGNGIESLSVLSHLQLLSQINASDNQLKDCLAFTAPKFDASDGSILENRKSLGSLLTLANLSANDIVGIRDLHDHPLLECLLLGKNRIARITGLTSLKFLKVLDLSCNLLSVIEGLDFLPVQELNLEGNEISTLSGLENLSRLSVLNVSRNRIKNLGPLKGCVSITHLHLEDNAIDQIRETENLQQMNFLKTLKLAGNRCTEKSYYRLRVLHRLPNLQLLDVTPVTSTEKIRSNILYFNSHIDPEDVDSDIITHFVDDELAEHTADHILLENVAAGRRE